MAGNIVGAIPVGMRTLGKHDEPYWPDAIVCCPREVWVHPVGLFVRSMDVLYAGGF